MYHMPGVTPEAPSVREALAGKRPKARMRVSARELQQVYRGYRIAEGGTVVVFSGPQLSLWEMKALAALFEGQSVHSSIRCFATTSQQILSEARKLGVAQALEKAGVVLLEGVCFYILERLSDIRRENGWANLVSNSAKLVNTITAHRFNTILRRTADCVRIAVTGEVA
jgi:predicted aconitase